MPLSAQNYSITILPDGSCRPYAITKRELIRIIGSPRIAQRLIRTACEGAPEKRWIEYFRKGGPGAESLFVVSTVESALERIRRGDDLPLLPSEAKRLVCMAAECRQHNPVASTSK